MGSIAELTDNLRGDTSPGQPGFEKYSAKASRPDQGFTATEVQRNPFNLCASFWPSLKDVYCVKQRLPVYL
jgi:hypothetical protein